MMVLRPNMAYFKVKGKVKQSMVKIQASARTGRKGTKAMVIAKVSPTASSSLYALLYVADEGFGEIFTTPFLPALLCNPQALFV